jgi:hypothetical protein
MQFDVTCLMPILRAFQQLGGHYDCMAVLLASGVPMTLVPKGAMDNSNAPL